MKMSRVQSLVSTLTVQAAFACSLLIGGASLAMAAAPFKDTMAQHTLACTACHGPQGRAAADGYYPRLAEKPAGYFYNQLLNFREERRHYGLMTQLIDPLSNAYLLEIAQYFSNLDLPYPRAVCQSGTSRSAGTAARLHQRAAWCLESRPTQGPPT